MVNKKQKERKQKIQEMQKKGRKEFQIQSLLDRQSELHAKAREAESAVVSLRRSEEAQSKQILDLERKLKARERDVTEMHNNHVKMRGSLSTIRELHLPERPTYDVDEDVPCAECQKRWPCPTYRKIRTPDHVVVSSLLDMARDLAKEDQDAEPGREE